MLSERDSDRERQRQREIEGDRERGCEGAAGLDSENAVLRRLTRAVGPAMAGRAGLAAGGRAFPQLAAAVGSSFWRAPGASAGGCGPHWGDFACGSTTVSRPGRTRPPGPGESSAVLCVGLAALSSERRGERVQSRTKFEHNNLRTPDLSLSRSWRSRCRTPTF